jgi:tRNA-Thr(GGU) m(6)t(6)A37 methyltransferase TsaA
MKPIALVRSDFPEKFGIPRQSGIVPELSAKIVFEPEYRQVQALRGLELYSHLWLIWEFSKSAGAGWSPTVRPPRLGGNTRMGVFATRSPFRPNPIGLSCVKIESIDLSSSDGPVIYISGADLMDGTPIFDIKPYIPYCDCHPEALGGFAVPGDRHLLEVNFPPELLQHIPEDKRSALIKVLSADPRPSYHDDAHRVYGMSFAGYNINFTVSDVCLNVIDVKVANQN